MALRMLTTLGRAGVTIVLAKSVSAEELGVYGLVVAISSIYVLVAGLDIYQGCGRDILKSKSRRSREIIVNQFSTYILIYVLSFLPLLFISRDYDSISEFAPFVLILCYLEHFSTEISRSLIFTEDAIESNLVHFLRHGLWSLGAVILWWLAPQMFSLKSILAAWTISVTASIILGVYYLYNSHFSNSAPLVGMWLVPSYIIQKMREAAPLFVSTLCVAAIDYGIRFVIDDELGTAALGVFVLFFSLSNFHRTFLYFGSISILYPRLMRAINVRAKALERKVTISMVLSVIGVSIPLVILCIFTAEPVFLLAGMSNYTADIDILILLVTAGTVNCLSLVPHFSLLARKEDRAIMWSTIIAVSGFAIYLVFFFPSNGLFHAAIAVLVGNSLLLLCKSAYLVLVSGRMRTEHA